MKRFILILLAIGFTTLGSLSQAAMSNSQIRKETRFLTDKMAHELKLNTTQYNDAYEINFDFISSIRYVMDDVIRGNEWALSDYYRSLDIRNDDLRWVMSDSQYRRFLRIDYFYRPIYASGGRWQFRVYITYTNHNHFYFGRPYHYRSYCGGHYRTDRNNGSYYRGRYNHSHYNGSHSVRDDKVYRTNRRSDFGSVTIRPNTSTRPSSGSSSGSSSRRESTTTNRESGSTRRNSSGNSSSNSNSNSNSNRSGNSSSSSNRSGSSNSNSNRSGSSNSSSNRSGSSSSSSRRSSSQESKETTKPSSERSSTRSSERGGESSRK